MTDPVVQFIKKGRRRLNRILSVYYYLEALFISSLITGVLLIILRFTYILWTDAVFFVFISLFFGIIGLISGFKNRLDNGRAAEWLDGRLTSNEALTAFLNNESQKNVFSEEIKARAEEFISESRRIVWPYHKIKISALKSFLALVIFGIFITFWMPDIQRGDNSVTPVQYRFNSSGTGTDNENPLASKSGQDAARMLLPQNKALSAQMEKAIGTADAAKLRELTGAWKSELEKRLQAALSEKEAKQIREEMEREKQMENRMNQRQSGEDGNKRELSRENNNKSKNAGENKENSNNKKSGDEQKGSSDQSGDDKNQKKRESGKNPSQSPGDENQGKKGRRAGTGAGKINPDWKETKKAKPKGKLDFGKRDSGPGLEWVNPGNGTAVPLSQILPDIRQSAEAAVNRDNIPGEYENFIGTYFQELSKEAAVTQKE